jgi:hypothetical protein
VADARLASSAVTSKNLQPQFLRRYKNRDARGNRNPWRCHETRMGASVARRRLTVRVFFKLENPKTAFVAI